MKLVCLGDSFTEGLCDQVRPDGEHLGWADRVAAQLPRPFEYANLAVRGKLLDQVVDEQIPVAQSLAPDVLTFHAGGNDVLRRSTDPRDLFRRYDAAVAELVAPGRRVLVFTSLSRTGGTAGWPMQSRCGSRPSTPTSGTWRRYMARRSSTWTRCRRCLIDGSGTAIDYI